MTNPNDSAYPVRLNPQDPHSDMGGLTKREYFAAMAMQGMMVADMKSDEWSEIRARRSIRMADSLIAELNK